MPLRSLNRTPELAGAQATDLRGRPLLTMMDRREVGEVADLLVDESGRPRYLVVALRGAGAGEILWPVARSRTDPGEGVVWLPGLTADRLGAVPAYGGDPAAVGGRAEREIERACGEAYGSGRHPGGSEPTRSVVEYSPDPGALATLDDLEDFKIADEDPDPHGWAVVAGDGVVAGRVHQLVVDIEVMKVRYLDCALAASLPEADSGDRHVLIPVGFARLDEQTGRVIVDTVSSREMARLPAYTGLPLNRRMEAEIHERFIGGARG